MVPATNMHEITQTWLRRDLGTHAARTAVYLDVSPFWRLAFYMFVFQAA